LETLINSQIHILIIKINILIVMMMIPIKETKVKY